MRRICNTLIMLIFVKSTSGFSVPLHGCTFYKPRLIAGSWPGGQNSGCFDVNVGPPGSCWKSNWPLPDRPAIQVTAWYPAYFVEVSFRVGSSMFSHGIDTAALSAHILKAETFWSASLSDVSPAKSTVQMAGYEQKIDSSLMFGRVLDVPYANVSWSFTFGAADSVGLPLCYKGISEFSPETWNDTFTSGDRDIAALWAPVNVMQCAALAPVQGAIASAKGAIRKLPIPAGSFPSGSAGCALPLPIWAQKARSLSSPTAMDPMKQCMGSLGGVLPRTGWTQGSELFTASQQVAWRTLSLTSEHQMTGVGMSADDKWQIVYPPVADPTCFAPGSLTRPTNVLPTTWLRDRQTGLPVHTPGSDNAFTRGGRDFIVFAVWKRKTSCKEASELGAIQADITAGHAVRASACQAANAADGMP